MAGGDVPGDATDADAAVTLIRLRLFDDADVVAIDPLEVESVLETTRGQVPVAIVRMNGDDKWVVEDTNPRTVCKRIDAIRKRVLEIEGM